MRKSVAILRADHIGDLVLTIPLAQSLSKHGWDVDILALSGVSLLGSCEGLRTAVDLHTICPNWPKDWHKLVIYLQQRRYTATLIPFCRPPQLLLASILSKSSRRVAMGTTGKARFLAWITGHRYLPTNFEKAPRPYYEILGDCALALGVNTHLSPPRIPLAHSNVNEVQARLQAKITGDTWIGIHPCCLGNTCNLPLDTYLELLTLVLENTSWSVIVTGSTDDRKHLKNWQSLAERNTSRVWMAAGELGLKDLPTVIAALDLFVVPSTGPLHIAQAVGTRTLTPFCPQRPVCREIWGYAPFEDTTILPEPPPCKPDLKHTKNCDFQGRIRAADLFSRLQSMMSAN